MPTNFFEPFDIEKITDAIEPEFQRFLAKITVFESIDSTNTYLLNQTKLGALSGTVCFAEQQISGRGRRGRQWFSMPGANIACSMLWHFTMGTEAISGLSIAVAVIVSNVLKKYGIINGVQLKWPNDVLFDGRKLAGILLERSGNSVVIGIGLNLYLPSDADSNWIALSEITNGDIKRNYLAGLLVNELLAKLPVYEMRGLSAFIDEWRQHDVFNGQSITVHTSEKNFSGMMKGINASGELILQDEEGAIRQFCYGEVSVRKNL